MIKKTCLDNNLCNFLSNNETRHICKKNDKAIFDIRICPIDRWEVIPDEPEIKEIQKDIEKQSVNNLKWLNDAEYIIHEPVLSEAVTKIKNIAIEEHKSTDDWNNIYIETGKRCTQLLVDDNLLKGINAARREIEETKKRPHI